MESPFQATFKQMMNEVVDAGACCACGACVLVCPHNVIEYMDGVPVQTAKSSAAFDFCGVSEGAGCDVCASVCPRLWPRETHLRDVVFGEERGLEDIFGVFRRIFVARASDKGIADAGQDGGTIPSDGATSPLRHFGVVLDPDAWKDMERRLTDAGVDWVLTPRVSFEGKPAEQRIMQCRDGVGNVVEFKGQPRDRVFATDAPD